MSAAEKAPLRRVCVYCGSSSGSSPRFRDGAVELGKLLAARGIGLVYGGGRRGIMGAIADAMLSHGGDVTGVIPRFLWERDLHHRDVSNLRVVESLHARKAKMSVMANAFIALPGGIGTLEETFEAWTWTQLGRQAKPVGLLDIDGFFKPLLAFIDDLVTKRFLTPAHRSILLVSESPADLLDRLAAWEPTFEEKWTG